MYVKMSVQGARTAADVDRWLETVLYPAVWKAFVEPALRAQQQEARNKTGPPGGIAREFAATDYDSVLKLWKGSKGIVLREVDERTAIRRYLRLNAGMSFVHEVGGEVVGSVLCGTDGRRGFLHHLAVAAAHRHRGIGRALVANALQALAKAGIDKCHLMVLPSNSAARAFWKKVGWVERDDVVLVSRTMSQKQNS